MKCPIRTISVMLRATMIKDAILSGKASLGQAEELSKLVDESDANCTKRKCAMWNNRVRKCGFISNGN